MVFSSTVFMFLFLPLCLILYYMPFIKSIKYKNIILLIFSIVFYAYGSLDFLLIFLLSIILNYIFGILINKVNKKKIILTIGILLNIALLAYFKIKGLLNVNQYLSSFNNFYSVALPLGISFFTFQEISYLVDIYRKIVPSQKNILKYALFVSFFPQLIAGPIIRYEDIYREIEYRKHDFNTFSEGIFEFTIGLFKKCAIADIIGKCALMILQTSPHSILLSWFGALSMMVQLYYDFSGYSNMAIGIGKMFGFHFKKNFDYPYVSTSITEYWERWNISLGKWFHDYLLFPICNSKVYKNTIIFLSKKISKKTAFTICNLVALFICWIFVGLWHGVGINYLILGIYYFILLSLEKLFRFPKKKTMVSHIYALFFITIGTVLFFSYNDSNFSFIKSLFINKKIIDANFLLYLKNYGFCLIIGILFSFPTLDKIKNRIDNKRCYSVFELVFITSLLIIAIYFMITNTYSPFIYFNF